MDMRLVVDLGFKVLDISLKPFIPFRKPRTKELIREHKDLIKRLDE